jgi:carbon-monoxide dehydrogenase medium subunit
MWKNYYIVQTVDELVGLLSSQTGQTRIIAGGTDLMVEIRNGKWPELDTVLDISRVPGLDQISYDADGIIHIGALVTHNDIIRSNLIRERGFPLLQACARVASPQLRNRGTVAGNLITASPANDTITPLMAWMRDSSCVLWAARALFHFGNFIPACAKLCCSLTSSSQKSNLTVCVRISSGTSGKTRCEGLRPSL